MVLMFIIGIVVTVLRFDASVEAAKAGRFTSIAGIPIRFLMGGFHFLRVVTLWLAFALPLRYYVDREVFLECLRVCWIFALVLAVANIIDYFGVYNMAFDYGRLIEAGSQQKVILGFLRGSNGKMLVLGIFLAFAMTQLTRSYLLKILGYLSAPILIMGLLFSYSRGSMVALIIASLSLVITLGGARAIKGVFLGVLGFLVVYIVAMNIPAMKERLSFIPIFVEAQAGQQDLAAISAGRTTLWVELLGYLSRSPGVLAVGAGYQNYLYFLKIQTGEVVSGHAHNNYLLILTEHGIVGLGIFIGWIVSIFYWLISWRRTMMDKVDKMMPGIFVSLMIGLAAGCMFGTSLTPSLANFNYMIHLYLIFGLWISYYRTSMTELYADWEMEYYGEEDELVAVGDIEEAW